jgi:hypothetical protein
MYTAATAAILGTTSLSLTFAPTAASAQTYTNQTILSTANIYGAGRTGAAAIPSPGGTTSGAPGPAGGSAAPVFALAAGTGRILTLSSVTGTMTFDYPDGYPYFDADGGTDVSSSISSFQGISGITETDRHGSLLGVFISGPPAGYADGASGSDDPALVYSATNPADLSYSSASYTPLLNQSFFIGDGLTGDGTGATQQFFVPDSATELVLGLSDGPAYNGAPGSYNDNTGSYTASFTISGSASAPEPTALLLFGPALLGIAAMVRRRR